MRSFTTVVALASVVPAVMSLTINTPSSVVQCQPQLLGWNDGTAPFYLSIIPGGQPSAPPLKTFDTQTGNTLTWKVDQPAGTRMTFSVKDATGVVAYSDIVTVQQGPDASCLSNSGGSPAPPPAAQDVSVNTATAPTSVVSSPSSSSVVVIQTGTIRPTSSASGVTASRAASVASASSSTSQSVSRTTTSARAAATSSSGAESSLSGHSYGFVGAVGLIGALFL